MDCLFCKIAKKELKSETVFENESLMAFKDIHPQARIHLLIIPKKHITTLNDATSEDRGLLGDMLLLAKELAVKMDMAQSGYRTVLNCNKEGGQTVFHLHLHVIGGRQLGGSMVG